MSRAFTKESDGEQLEPLPELTVSPHRNLVTAAGLRRIEATVDALAAELSEARAAEDRARIDRIERDLRYWRARRASAEVVATPATTDSVRFGSTVVLETDSGQRRTYRIVGEDESDPRQGLISYVSPLAEQLLGSRVGDVVRLRDEAAEILSIA